MVAWEHCSAIEPFNETTFMPDLPAQQHRRAYCELAAGGLHVQRSLTLTAALSYSGTADAAVTHTDRLIGDTLGKLESLHMSDSTTVVVVGDHGYFLRELSIPSLFGVCVSLLCPSRFRCSGAGTSWESTTSGAKKPIL
jgi:hypothetical protein